MVKAVRFYVRFTPKVNRQARAPTLMTEFRTPPDAALSQTGAARGSQRRATLWQTRRSFTVAGRQRRQPITNIESRITHRRSEKNSDGKRLYAVCR